MTPGSRTDPVELLPAEQHLVELLACQVGAARGQQGPAGGIREHPADVLPLEAVEGGRDRGGRHLLARLVAVQGRDVFVAW